MQFGDKSPDKRPDDRVCGHARHHPPAPTLITITAGKPEVTPRASATASAFFTLTCSYKYFAIRVQC